QPLWSATSVLAGGARGGGNGRPAAPDNAWRADWFLGIGRNAQDAGIGTASFSILSIAANALPGAIVRPVPSLQPHPGAAEKLSFCQYVSRLGHPGRRLCTNRGAADEPQRGSARLMGTGIVGCNPFSLILGISSAAPALVLP